MNLRYFLQWGRGLLFRAFWGWLGVAMGLGTAGLVFASNPPTPPAKTAELVLVAPQASEYTPLRAGSSIQFIVVFTNPWDEAVLVPDILPLTLTRDKETRDKEACGVTARLVGPQGDIPAKGFLKQTYEFDLPRQMTGLLSIAHTGSKANIAMFKASEPQKESPGGKNLARSSIEEQQNQFQPFFVNFSAHKPVYFLFGVEPGIQKSSFQISFKYKLFNFDSDSFLKSYFSGLEKIYLAYTQQSFWDLKSDSAPFEDSRYMPEVFYYNDNLGLDLPYMIGSGIQTGFQHESNGRDVNSRSTNYGYIQPIMAFKFTEKVHLKLAPKAWVYIRNDNETNGDLADYRGYFDIETKLGDPKGLALENHFRHGKNGGTWQFDLSYPLNQIPWFKGLLDVYLHAQYFTGYSDNLIRYNQREDVFRLGFSLVR